MNFYRVGNTVLNLDRVNCVLDRQTPAEPAAPENRTVLRVVFDHAQIDLTDKEAQAFRNWFRHAARTIDPRKDEDGEDLVSPDMQVRRACAIVRDLIEHERPRDRAARQAIHRLMRTVDEFLTGELQPVRDKDFEKDFLAV
jgi:hypothetical protein